MYFTGQEQQQEQTQDCTPWVPEPIDVAALISKNGDSPTLDLVAQGITGPDMKIVADTLRNNTVKG
jgi:hypothetical protein